MNVNPRIVIERGVISCRNGESIPEENVQQVGVDIRLLNGIVILPKGFINTEIYEKFDMQDTFGWPVIRSSFSRKGIFLSTGCYDPGFNGAGGCTIYNMTEETITIPAMTRFAQFVVFKANAAKNYDGHYNKTTNIESKINL
jgi:deoxycytidine triphosphate deaminase